MLSIPTTAHDIQAVNRIIKQIRQKAVGETANPILRRFLVNTADSTTVSNTTTLTNYSLTYTHSANLMRAGTTMHQRASGIYSNSGAGTHTIQFRLRHDTNIDILTFDPISITGNNTNAAWIVDILTTVKTAGVSGALYAAGICWVAHGGGTRVITQDIQSMATNLSHDLSLDHTILMAVTHGVANANTTSIMRDFAVDIMQ